METEKTNEEQNHEAKFREIMDALKTVMDESVQTTVRGQVIPPAALGELVEVIEYAINFFKPYSDTFTPKDRSRLIGGGIKNLGFIETAYGSAVANPQFVPPFLNINDYGNQFADFTRKRTIYLLLQQFLQQVSDAMLFASDTAYHNSLEYYNSVKEAARQRISGAEAEYKLISPYFKRGKLTPVPPPPPNEE
jgi:hypothetical protein